MAVVTSWVTTGLPVADPSTVSSRPRPLASPWLLVVLGVAVGVIAVHVVLGAGFVLDDWYLVRNAFFDGPGHVVEPDLLRARPGSLLAYGVSFGFWPTHPLAVLLVQGALFVLAAGLGFRILQRVLDPRIACAVAVTWVLLPNHLSIERWGSVIVANSSLVLLALGMLLLLRSPLSNLAIAGACASIGLACLSYESTIVMGAASFVLLPWYVMRRPVVRAIVAGAVTLGAVLAWQLLHWHSVKKVGGNYSEYSRVVEAHFGWGIVEFRPVAVLVLAVVVLVSILAVVDLVVRDRRPALGTPHWLVFGGWFVLLAGSAPFAAYIYEPVGAGDRVNYLSSWGAAAVLVGSFLFMWRHLKLIAGALAAVVLVAAVVTRVDRSATWADAATDARAVIAQISDGIGRDCPLVVLGPSRVVRDNVASFMDRSNVEAAVEVALDKRGAQAMFARTPEEFYATDPSCRVDVVKGSLLAEPAS
jgi:hypothetical protein